MFDFLHMTPVDIIDILLVAFIMYIIYRRIKGSSAMNIFIAIILVLCVRVLASALGMKMVSSILGTVIDVGAVAIIIIFQPEIRQFLIRIGRGAGISKTGRSLVNKFMGREDKVMESDTIDEIATACMEMGEDKTGALIVIPHKDPLADILSTGDKVDAIVSKRLIMNIFFKNSPLHDGAMVLDDGRIAAARCTLPITDRTDIPAHYGMRHKAAFGITERCDASVIVVSEETGTVSYFSEGGVRAIDNISTLKLILAGKGGENK